jgi:hypothetical protein
LIEKLKRPRVSAGRDRFVKFGPWIAIVSCIAEITFSA